MQVECKGHDHVYDSNFFVFVLLMLFPLNVSSSVCERDLIFSEMGVSTWNSSTPPGGTMTERRQVGQAKGENWPRTCEPAVSPGLGLSLIHI